MNTEKDSPQLNLFAVKKSYLFDDIRPHILKKFWQYHKDNPHVFELYKRFTGELVTRGRTRYGIGSITERIRWHTAVETNDPEFKISNNHRSCYARLLIMEDPRLEKFFQLNSKSKSP